MNTNKYSFRCNKNFSFGKGITVGNVIGHRGDTGTPSYEQIQEHTETIYSFGWFSVIVYHYFNFVKFA